MGIIGVVAALTIPNLNGSTNDMEKIAKVKKVYANLTEAFDRATAVYGPIETWFVNDGDDADKKSQRLAERLAEFLKLSKGVSLDTYNEPIFILADGTAVSLSVWEEDEPCTSAPQYILKGVIYLDIDGENKGKNQEVIVQFLFDITNGGIVPVKDASLRFSSVNCEEDFSFCISYTGAAYWIIQNGNMDYLKVDADGKCPKSDKVLSWSNPSCK